MSINRNYKMSRRIWRRKTFRYWPSPNSRPDIPETIGVVVVLQPRRHPLWVWLVRQPLLMCGRAGQFDMVLDKHPVVKDSDKSGAEEFPVFVKSN
jgi:hypothetical protein